MDSSEEERVTSQHFVRVSTISSNVIEDILASIATVPGYTSNIQKKGKLPFSFSKNERGEYTVCVPNNLESYADNWIFKTGVAAAQLLKATFEPCDSTVEEYKYLSDCEEYLQGLGAALKLQTLSEPVGTGLFLHGFSYVASFALKKLPNPNMFRTAWHTPVYALTKKEAWAGLAGGPHYNVWYSLIQEAAKHINVPQPEKFCRSFEELKKLTKQSWHYEARSVFSSRETSIMEAHTRDIRTKHNNFVESLRRPTTDIVMNWHKDKTEASRALSDYDEQIGSIGSRRANIIFPKKKSKGKTEKGLTREARLADLVFGQYVAATNSTGLVGDNRLEFIPTGKTELSHAQQFLEWADRQFLGKSNIPDHVLEWAKDSAAMAKTIVEDV